MINFSAAILILALWTIPVQAKEGGWDSAEQVRARLLSAIDTVGSDKTFEALLQKRLSPGWHTYWRTPGEAGLAPTFDWSGSENIENVEIFFPVPGRFDELGLTTFGYDGEVQFPMRVTLREPDKAAKLDLKLDTLVCHEICIPQHLDVSLDLEEGEGMDSASAILIEHAWNRIPQPEDHNLKIENIVAGPKGLVVSAYAKAGFDRADLFVELPDYALVSLPEIEPASDEDEQRARLIIAPPEEAEDFLTFLKGKEVRVTLTDGRSAVEQVVQY